MGINLYDIQPGDEYLRKSGVEYFRKHPDRLFKETHQIKIIQLTGLGLPFQYYAIDGNKRLFVCHELKKLEIPIAAIPFKKFPSKFKEIDIELAMSIYSEGIKSWKDLEERVISDEEYDSLTSL